MRMKGWCWRLGVGIPKWRHYTWWALTHRWVTSRCPARHGSCLACSCSSLCFPFLHCHHLLLQQLLLLLLRCTCETDLCSSFCAYLTWNACPTLSLLYHVYKTKAFVINLVLKIGLQPFTLYVKKCSAGEQTAYLYSNFKALRFVWVTSVSRAQLSFTTTSLNMIHIIYFIFHLEVKYFIVYKFG